MKSVRYLSIAVTILLITPAAFAQETPDPVDTEDPIYQRPFVTSFGGGRTAVGGYAEGNTNYFSEDGVSEGFSMEFRRFNLFLFSNVGRRISFFSELEFEHGTEEIKLETALVDLDLDPALKLRAGIILPPLGLFNQNHDSPKWDIVDRPLVSTTIIPSTLSEVGFGIHGRLNHPSVSANYELYVVNGIGAGVVSNEEGRTFIPAGKAESAFEEDNNGVPSLTGRVGVSNLHVGEAGLSFYTGTYNSFRIEGEDIDSRRRLTIVAADVSTSILTADITGEAAYASIDVASGLGEFFGDRQAGLFLDVVVPIVQRRILRFDAATLNVVGRYEYVDYNLGTFESTEETIHDSIEAIVAGLSFRASPEFVLKLNYRYHWIKDILGNPSRLGGFQAGFATYF